MGLKARVWLVLLGLWALAACAPAALTPTPAADPLRRVFQAEARGYAHTALYQIELAAQQTGWTPELHQRAGNLWRRLGDLRRALPHYEAAANASADPELLRLLADVYLKTSHAPEALQTILRLLTLAPGDAWGNYQAGLLLAPADPRRARDYLSRVALDETYAPVVQPLLALLRDQPADTFIGFRVGAALAASEQWLYAELAFQYAADANYPYPEALAYLGLMRDFQGKDGAPPLRLALRFAPNNPQVRLVEGLHLRARQDYEASLIALSGALALDPRNPALHAELGRAYQLLGRFEQAEYWLRSAVTLADNDPALAVALQDLLALEQTMSEAALQQAFAAQTPTPAPPPLIGFSTPTPAS